MYTRTNAATARHQNIKSITRAIHAFPGVTLKNFLFAQIRIHTHLASVPSQDRKFTHCGLCPLRELFHPHHGDTDP